jgi:membrane protein
MFYTWATLGPLLVLYSLQQSLVRNVSETAWGAFLVTTAGMILINRWLPNTKVRWSAALIGGVVAAVLFDTGKNLFTFYVQQIALDTYVGLYGSLAVMPIFMVWSYVSWLVVLLGAEVAYGVHHAHSIRLQGHVNPYLNDPFSRDKATGRTAARLLLAVADNYDLRNAGITRDQLADRFRLHLGRVTRIMDQLAKLGYVLEADRPQTGYVPARPLDRIQVRDVLAAFDDEEASDTRNDELGELFGALDAARDQVTAQTTYADLVAQARARRGGPVVDIGERHTGDVS